MMRGLNILLYAFVSILLLSVAYAEPYYADVSFDVSESGEVSIDALTNSPLFEIEKSHKFTSKIGSLWTINISDDSYYSDMYYEVVLPENAQIRSMQSTVSGRILVNDNKPIVKGAGHNDTFGVVIQYELGQTVSQGDSFWYYVAGIGLIIIGLVFIFRKSKKESVSSSKKESTNSLSTLTAHLESRQKDIVNLLAQRGKLTQKQIADELDIPKSSVFRNIRSLEQKGLVKKETVGMSTIITLSSTSN